MGSWWMREAHTCLWLNWSGFPSWNLLLPLHPGSCPLCEGWVRLWLWLLSPPQISTWFMAGKSPAPTQLLFNKGQISLPSTLLSPISLTPYPSTQIQHNTAPPCPPTCLHTNYSHDMQHDCLPFYPASVAFFTQFFFFPSLHFGQALWFFLHDINRKQTCPSHSFPKTLS